MSYKAIGADTMPWYSFTNREDGVRLFSDQSRDAILKMMDGMYVGPQIPGVDEYGTRVLMTPGVSSVPGLPTGRQAAVAAARAGQTILVLESFSPTINQSLRMTTAVDKLQDITNPDGQGYAVLLTPETAQSMSPFEPAATEPPGEAPPAPPPAQGSGIPAATGPSVSTSQAGLFGMTQTQTLLVGGGAALLLAMLVMSGRPPAPKRAMARVRR